jgi:hypothetical protein
MTRGIFLCFLYLLWLFKKLCTASEKGTALKTERQIEMRARIVAAADAAVFELPAIRKQARFTF